MKKILFVVALLVGLLIACSDDPQPYEGKVVDGMYHYYGKDYAVALSTKAKAGWSPDTNAEPGYITITDLSTAEYVFYQEKDIKPINKDGYSGWAYSNGLSLVCIPKSEKTFVAKVLTNPTEIALPSEMLFNFRKF